MQATSGYSLAFSFVGYLNRCLLYQGQQTLTIKLCSARAELDRVVVIGYQMVRKKDLTGATGVVDMENATRISAGSVAEGIWGLVPGGTVRNGGAPGQNSGIEIRGVSRFSNASPFYVIDGMLSDATIAINPDSL